MKYLAVFCLLCLSGSFALPLPDKGLSAAVPQTVTTDPEGPLFELLSVKKTHVTFNNELKDTKEHNIMIYSNYYGGAGVGVGDLNNDGLPDLYFAGNLVADQLYLNLGNLEFENITDQAGITDNGGWSSGVIFADVNQDGWLDIYVTRELYDDAPDLRRNRLYISQGVDKAGKLSFKEQAAAYGVDDSERTRHATFLDYDHDGDLDLFLLNQPPNPGDYSKYYNTELLQEQYSPRLLQNNGAKFVDVTEKAGLLKAGFPNSVTASDLNGDGWTDLYVANDFWVGDWLYLNNGDGTFSDKIHENLRHISFSSMGVDAGDINNDGLLDVMVVDMVAEDNYRLKTNMSGMNPEAFWKVVRDGGHHQYMFNMLHLNSGEAQFSDIAQLANVASTDWSWSNLLADFDNDGWKDIFVTNGLMRDIRNNDASKKFPKYLEKALHDYLEKHPNPGDISIWDIVNIEEALKLVPSVKLSNYGFRNNGDLTFSKVTEEWGLSQKTFSNGSAYADLDLDGDLDLVINNVNDPASIYRNHAVERNNSHYLRIKPLADQAGVTAFGCKVWLEQGGSAQFQEITNVRGMYSTSEPVAHFGLGAQAQAATVRIQWPDGKTQLLHNVAADQVIEAKYSQAAKLQEPAAATPATIFQNINEEIGLKVRHKENVFDDFKIQVLMPQKMSNLGPCLASADLNGDGLDDFYIGGAAKEAGRIFIQQANGSFIPAPGDAFETDKLHEDLGATFFDSDQDGDLDLYVVSGGNEFLADAAAYQDRLYINDGAGNYRRDDNCLPQLTFCGSKVYPADFDQDGDLDLFVAGRHVAWAYPMPATSALLLNEGGKFRNVTEQMAPDLVNIGMINDAAWMDYDQDGRQDLVLVGEWTPIIVLNNQTQVFSRISSATLDQSKGWWFSIATADMDGDGDEDIVVGNLGHNYKYKASDEEPFEVYYYDFDENGSKDVVLTYYNFGIKYPLRGRQCSSEQVPEIKEKFQTYDLFASSDVVKIYGKNELEESLHLEATTFGSAWLENLGNGRFERHELPVMAQLSSVNDILLEDFNGDGHRDMLLAGNLYGAEVETARDDAGYGMLLTGDGKGQFTAMSRRQSGFFVPYDVKSMALLKSAKGKTLLVGCNDDQLQAFRWMPKP